MIRGAWSLLATAASVACAGFTAWALAARAERWDAWAIVLPFEVGAVLAILAVCLPRRRAVAWIVLGVYAAAFLLAEVRPAREFATAIVRAAVLVGMER